MPFRILNHTKQVLINPSVTALLLLLRFENTLMRLDANLKSGYSKRPNKAVIADAK
jgi:hypothetical protein